MFTFEAYLKGWGRTTSPESLQPRCFVSLHEEKTNWELEKAADEHLHFVNNRHGRTVFCYCSCFVFSSSSLFMISWQICISHLPKHTLGFWGEDCMGGCLLQRLQSTQDRISSLSPNRIEVFARTCSGTDCTQLVHVPFLQKGGQANKTRSNTATQNSQQSVRPLHMLACPHFKKKAIPIHSEEEIRVNKWLDMFLLANTLCFPFFHQHLNSVCFRPRKSKHLYRYIPVR